jgi:hypothetical protein
MINPPNTKLCYRFPYTDLYKNNITSQTLQVIDHMGGFDGNLKNTVLDYIQSNVDKKTTVLIDYIFESKIKNNYNLLDFKWQDTWVNNCFNNYKVHPDINYTNFVCSFNGTDHVSRKLLVAILERFGYFNLDHCSKNFVFTVDKLDGHITDYTDDQDNFYCKFFIANNSDVFFNKVNSFGHVRFDHAQNIYNLEHKLTQSFLHIVSESLATSYYPFVTEKFLYSVITRGLFLAYAQPEWHAHLEKYYGFKRYTKLFDYGFDSIQNPVVRLVELMTMISKFNLLTPDDWKDLYQIEQETIEYNYHHYFSQDYLKCLAKYS